MKYNSSKGFKKFAIILSIFFGIILLYYFLGPKLPFVKEYVSNKDYVAVLHVEGTIMKGGSGGFFESEGYNHEFILSQIDSFMNDQHNLGIVLFIDSPGGGIYETDEVYLKLLKYKAETNRPIYVSMGRVAASGGYYISTAADKIVANRNTITGSIGVTMGTFYDISEFLSEHGIHSSTMTAGRNKAMGDLNSPMSSEQKKIFQSLLDESYDQFVDVIIKGRNIPEEKVKEIADGRIYSAKQAYELELIDDIGTLDDTIQGIMTDNELNDCEVRYFWYESNTFMSSFFNVLTTASADYYQGEMGMVLKLLNRQENIPIAYLYDFNGYN